CSLHSLVLRLPLLSTSTAVPLLLATPTAPVLARRWVPHAHGPFLGSSSLAHVKSEDHCTVSHLKLGFTRVGGCSPELNVRL
ncbi:hypothetical protein BDP27DRAFT_1445010, partial [Rhodocollybia butyracea]